jgi:hypothetical protein
MFKLLALFVLSAQVCTYQFVCDACKCDAAADGTYTVSCEAFLQFLPSAAVAELGICSDLLCMRMFASVLPPLLFFCVLSNSCGALYLFSSRLLGSRAC